MILAMIIVWGSMAENDWCIKKIAGEELALMGVLSAVALADTFITGMIIYFIVR